MLAYVVLYNQIQNSVLLNTFIYDCRQRKESDTEQVQVLLLPSHVPVAGHIQS